MAISGIDYGGTTTIGCGVASLATSATFVAGRESDEVNNTIDKFVDASLEGFISTGTSPTNGKQIRVYVWGSHTSLASVVKDVLDGVDSAETISNSNFLSNLLKLAEVITVSGASNAKYHFGPLSITELFGHMPKYWGLFVTQSSAVALHATASNHEFKYTGIKYGS